MLSEIKHGKEIHGEVMSFTQVHCCTCGAPFFMLTRFRDALRESGNTFYCPSGHSMVYEKSNETEKLKKKLEALQIEKNKQYNEMQDKWLDALGEKNKLVKKLKRVHNGVCPCCNRSFINLQKHIENKHPELNTKNPVADIHKKINNKK